MRVQWLIIAFLPFLNFAGDIRIVTDGTVDGSQRDTISIREAATVPVVWRGVKEQGHIESELIKILAINDFHGQLSAGHRIENRPVGGAAILAAYLRQAQNDPSDSRLPEKTLIAHAGDHVGASPPESSFFQDEPSIAFLNSLANSYCSHGNRLHPKCNIVGTVGNHEFDEGETEMLRLIEGGNHSSGPYIDNPYRGTRFPYISANVVDRVSGEPILPPFVVKEVGAIKLAFIGAVLKETPTVVMPAGISHLRFLDEIESINRYVRYLRESRDIRTFVVLIHQGGRQTAYEGPTQPGVILTGQEIMKIIEGLDDDVDVVVSGHSHNFTNTLVKNSHGKDILVIQAFASGTAYADIQLQIDRSTGDVVEKVGAIVTAYADRGPGLVPDPEVKQLVSLAEQKVAPLTMRFIGEAQTEILRIENEAGESDLGNLVADAQRAAMKTDFAFMNPGGLRADLPKGAISFRDLFLVQPFSNTLLRMTLSGQDIYDLLNQQWVGQSRPRMLKVSGLTYSWDNRRLPGEKVVDVRGQDGLPLDRAKTYSITVNDYLAAGGDRFSVFIKGRDRVGGPVDIEALVSYVKLLPQPFECPSNNRILRLR